MITKPRFDFLKKIEKEGNYAHDVSPVKKAIKAVPENSENHVFPIKVTLDLIDFTDFMHFLLCASERNPFAHAWVMNEEGDGTCPVEQT